jgi:hypothetical protein
VQPEHARRLVERAQHHDDPAVLANVRDRLGAAAYDVEVGDRGGVEHAQRARGALRRDVHVAAGVERRGRDEEDRLLLDPGAQVVADPLVLPRVHAAAV